MDANVDTLTDEEVLAVLGQCNEHLKMLTERWRKEVTAPRAQASVLHDDIVTAMQTCGVEAVRYNDVFLRLQHKKKVSKALTPELVSEVVRSLDAATFRSKMLDIDAERVARFAKWQEKHAKPIKNTKRRKTTDGASNAVEATSTCLLSEGIGLPVEPRRVGKYFARALPAMSRPLTRQEALCAVLYALVEDAHRCVKPRIAVAPASGRTSSEKIIPVEEAEDGLRVNAAAFCDLMTNSTAASASIRAERPRYQEKMQECNSRAKAYIRSVAPDTKSLKRVLPTTEGDRTIKFTDLDAVDSPVGDEDADRDSEEELAKRKSTLSLWSVSSMIDKAVDAVCLRHDFIKHDETSVFSYDDIPAMTERAVLDAVRERIDDALSCRSDETSVISTQSSSCVKSLRIRRTRLRPCNNEPGSPV